MTTYYFAARRRAGCGGAAVRAATAWIRGDEHAPDWVPDLTTSLVTDWPRCDAREPRKGYWCTRLFLHTGRHAAGDGTRIVAVWP